MRFPVVSTDRMAFVAYGNLWTVARKGAIATSLTNDPGQVLSPHFSPDGRSIAFTWQREGGSDVYVIPSSGGAPVRLTHGPTLDSYDNIVAGWTADGSGILFLSRRASAFYHQYDTFVVRASGGLAVSLGLGPSGFSSLSADGHQIAFDRTFRNLAGDRWKHYVGGQAPDVFIYDFTRSSLQRLTDWKGLDTAPMWSGRRIYYLSDRGPEGRANLRSTDLDTRRARQITFFRDLDVDVPSIGPGGIAFQHGGRVYRLDLPSERVSEVRVTVPEQPRMAAHDIAVERFVSRSDYAASNAGAILVARGDLFTLAAGGKVRNLTRTSAVVLSISKPSPMKFCWR